MFSDELEYTLSKLSEMQRFYFMYSICSLGSNSQITWNDPEIGIEWPSLCGEYQGSASTEGYHLEDGTPLILSEKDQKWTGLNF